jgi:hypothetical protein
VVDSKCRLEGEHGKKQIIETLGMGSSRFGKEEGYGEKRRFDLD